MDLKIRVIKRRDQKSREPELERLEHTSRPNTREITGTVKLWVSEFKERRRSEEQDSRRIYRLTGTAASLLLILSGERRGRPT
jgi:hypothetical protein